MRGFGLPRKAKRFRDTLGIGIGIAIAIGVAIDIRSKATAMRRIHDLHRFRYQFKHNQADFQVLPEFTSLDPNDFGWSEPGPPLAPIFPRAAACPSLADICLTARSRMINMGAENSSNVRSARYAATRDHMQAESRL